MVVSKPLFPAKTLRPFDLERKMNNSEEWAPIQQSNRFVARRFPKVELATLEPLQKLWLASGNYRSSAQRYYPQHDVWIERTRKELHEGKRKAALGIFVRGVRLDTNEFCYRPVASVVIGHSVFNPNDIELKSLLVDSDLAKQVLGSRGNPTSRVKQALLKYAELYCALRGFQELEIEIPADETGQVSFALESGFTIRTLYSKPRSDYRFYRLFRSISPVYGGDPFDELSIAKWFVRTNFTSQPVEVENEQVSTIKYDGREQQIELRRLVLSILPSSPFADIEEIELSAKQTTTEKEVEKRRMNELSITTQVTCVPMQLNSLQTISIPKTCQLNILISTVYPKKQLVQLVDSTWKIFGNDDLPLFVGSLSSWALNRVKPNMQGGLILDLDDSYSQALLCRDGRTWTYFTPNGFGKYCDHAGEDIAIFCSRGNQPQLPFGGARIWGYATIDDEISGDRTLVEEEEAGDRLLTTSDDIFETMLGFRGSIYTDIRAVDQKDFRGLKMSDTHLLSVPLSLSDFIDDGWCSNDVSTQLKNYEELCVTALADEEVLQKLRAVPEPSLFPPEPVSPATDSRLVRVDYESRSFYIDQATRGRFLNKVGEVLTQSNAAHQTAPQIFLCHRTTDSVDHIVPFYSAIESWSKSVSPSPSIFLDKHPDTGLKGGDKMRSDLLAKVNACRVFILLIGNRWSGTDDPNKSKRALSRLNEAGDYVCEEVLCALKRLDETEFTFLPIYLDGAKIPELKYMSRLSKLRNLLKEIHVLCYTSATHFEDVRKVIDALSKAFGL